MPLAPIVLKGQARMLEPLVTLLMAIYTLLEEKNVGTFYAIPVTTFQDQFTFPPQIKLIFYQDHKTSQEIDGKKIPVYGEISFRIIGETEKTINEAKAKAIAQKIKTKFATGTSFVWNKGTLICSYLDKEKGYDFRLRVTTESEAKKIIEQVMDIQNHSPDWDRLEVHESKKNFPSVPSKEIVYGASRRLPRRRPVAPLLFRYAELHVWGLTSAVSLVDTTGRRSPPLV